MIDNRISTIYQQLKQELKQATSDATPGTISNFYDLALAKCNTAKTDITTEYTKILRGGKSIAKELGMLDELNEAMKALAKLRKLRDKMALKEQRMQETWSKLVTLVPDVPLDPNLPNPYNRRDGGNGYE